MAIAAIAMGLGRIAGVAARGAATAGRVVGRGASSAAKTTRRAVASGRQNILKKAILKRKKIKRKAFIKERIEKKKNIENKQRMNKEKLLESRPSGGMIVGAASIPGMGFLQRILKFIGVLLIGWLAKNIPKIITFVQDLIKRVKSIVKTLKDFFGNLVNWFKGIGKVISAAVQNFLSLDFNDTSGKINDAMKELGESFEGMKKNIEDGKKHLTTPIGKGAGESQTQKQDTSRQQDQSSAQGSGGQIDAKKSVGGGGSFGESALVKALDNAGITNKTERAMFLSQMAHESGNFLYDEEIASGQNYEGRSDLGNTQPGDGRRYKGRGYIQITGRANYRHYGRRIGVDLENNPELAKRPDIAAAVALAYWDERVDRKAAARGDVRTVTYNINGGYNGLSDRKLKFKKYMKSISSGSFTPAPAKMSSTNNDSSS